MTTKAEVALRPAGHLDSADLHAWRNDPATRSNSRNTAEIDWPTHEGWLARALVDGRRRIWIAERDGRKLGTVSAICDGVTVELSITVAPDLRGQGQGTLMIRAAVAQAGRIWPGQALRAVVRVGNTASRRLFESCGFRVVESDDEFLIYEFDA